MEGLPPEKELTHHDLCLVMKTSGVSFSDHKNQLKVLEDYITSAFKLKNQITEEDRDELRKKLSSFLAHAIARYKKETRKFDQFLSSSKNEEFLKNIFSLPESIVKQDAPEEKTAEEESASKKPKFGRKPLPFEEKSTRAQQYASAKVRELHEPGAIVLAASQQSTPLGQLVRKAKSPSGRTASLALQAIKSPSAPGILL